jgi:hypothetical protein
MIFATISDEKFPKVIFKQVTFWDMCRLMGTEFLEETLGYPKMAEAVSSHTMLEYSSIWLHGTTSHNTVMSLYTTLINN